MDYTMYYVLCTKYTLYFVCVKNGFGQEAKHVVYYDEGTYMYEGYEECACQETITGLLGQRYVPSPRNILVDLVFP